MSGLTRFLGDTPFRVFMKLLLLSFLVGILMSAFGWYPIDVLDTIVEFAQRLWNMGFEAFYRFGHYLLLGAAIVVPVFLLLRLFSYRR